MNKLKFRIDKCHLMKSSDRSLIQIDSLRIAKQLNDMLSDVLDCLLH